MSAVAVGVIPCRRVGSSLLRAVVALIQSEPCFLHQEGLSVGPLRVGAEPCVRLSVRGVPEGGSIPAPGSSWLLEILLFAEQLHERVVG